MTQLQEVLFWGLIIYYLVINIVLYVAMVLDKQKAIKNKRRIPEKTLFLMAILGGSIGGFIAMYTKRHKTRHISFVAAFALTTILHGLLVFLLMTKVIFV